MVGARPQFVKLAPIAHAIEGQADHIVIHTGQHYDDLMSEVFFRDLQIPAPEVNLAVGSGKHGAQTADMLRGLEDAFEEYSPDWVLVYGDTNSTLAAAIAAVKLHFPLAHLEAGLRSFNRRMPEEHNRVLTDHASDLCLAPTKLAMDHLESEGLGDRSVLVGDVMTDILLSTRDRNSNLSMELPAGLTENEYFVCTLHRPDNTDDPVRLKSILGQLSLLDRPVLLLAHPRLVHIAKAVGIKLEKGAIRVADPLAYPQLVYVVEKSRGVITDSGGLQKEAFLLRVPCTTIRPETEWQETVALGWNVLISEDLSKLSSTVARALPAPTDAMPYGDGHTAQKVVRELLNRSR